MLLVIYVFQEKHIKVWALDTSQKLYSWTRIEVHYHAAFQIYFLTTSYHGLLWSNLHCVHVSGGIKTSQNAWEPAFTSLTNKHSKEQLLSEGLELPLGLVHPPFPSWTRILHFKRELLLFQRESSKGLQLPHFHAAHSVDLITTPSSKSLFLLRLRTVWLGVCFLITGLGQTALFFMEWEDKTRDERESFTSE